MVHTKKILKKKLLVGLVVDKLSGSWALPFSKLQFWGGNELFWHLPCEVSGHYPWGQELMVVGGWLGSCPLCSASADPRVLHAGASHGACTWSPFASVPTCSAVSHWPPAHLGPSWAPTGSVSMQLPTLSCLAHGPASQVHCHLLGGLRWSSSDSWSNLSS